MAVTEIALDTLYSQYDVVRRDNYIDALSFARNANVNGQPMVSVRELEVDSNGSLIYGEFDGVNLRSESLLDRFTTTFERTNLSVSHIFNENWEIDYVLQSEDGVPTLTTTNDLIGLSENAASATLYYENEQFSVRTTGSYRSGYLGAVPSDANDSDVLGNESTFFMDASASYYLSDSLTLTFEAQNLTNERNTLYIDSERRDPLFETEIGRTCTVGVSAAF